MNDIPTTTRQIVLASRPQGEPTAENFRLEDAPLPDLQDGQVLVHTSLMSVIESPSFSRSMRRLPVSGRRSPAAATFSSR